MKYLLIGSLPQRYPIIYIYHVKKWLQKIINMERNPIPGTFGVFEEKLCLENYIQCLFLKIISKQSPVPDDSHGLGNELGRHKTRLHGDVINMKHFLRYLPFVRGIPRSPVNSPHKGQWRGALMFSLTCARINGWVNNGEAGDLTRRRAHYDVIVMKCCLISAQETQVLKHLNEEVIFSLKKIRVWWILIQCHYSKE